MFATDRRRLIGRLAAAAALPALPLKASAAAVSEVAALERAVVDTMRSLAIPGANVIVETPRVGTWRVGFGFSEIDENDRMRPEFHLRVGSVTKTMTATVVLQLVDEGTLSLDDTLANALPAHAEFPYAEQITIRQMLAMRSGVFDCLDDESVFPAIMADPERVWTAEEFVEIAARHDPEFTPGTAYGYSNTNYLLLGLIVEARTGQPIAAELDRRLFSPLGMTGTSLPGDAALPIPFAHGYVFQPDEDGGRLHDWTVLNATVAGAAGGVVSTVDDLHAWLRALIDGSLISAPLQRERLTFTPVERDPGEPSYAYGLGLANHDGLIGHDGSILGYQSFIGHRPETGDSIVVLANLHPTADGTDAAIAIARAIDAALASTR